MIVGFDDNSIKVLSLEPETMFVRVSLQGSLPASPCSIAIAEMDGQLHLHVGLENGVLLRTIVDSITGTMSDSRQKFLGQGKINLSKITVKK